METIYYVGYYGNLENNKKTRNYSLAAAKKMDFIAGIVRDLGYKVNIVSPSYITERDYPVVPETTLNLSDGISLVLTPSSGANNKLKRIVRVLKSKLWLFIYLMKHTKKNDNVIFYHNYDLAYPVLSAKRLKGFNLILEVEEQYSMVWKLSKFQKHKEDILLKHGKKNSLVVSEVLAEKLQIDNAIISYGNYNAYDGTLPQKTKRDKIRLIYTGSIDKVKNSAYMALEVMPYLSHNYELKLSGPIAKGEDQIFEKKIQEINKSCGRKACEYMGLLGDEDYKELLLSADIALNLQQDGEFGEYLFPSKILTYLSYNLPVVSTKGMSIVKSQVANLIEFSNGYDAPNIAKAIQAIDLNQYVDRRSQLKQMSDTFKKRMKTILI